jgi:hypothetical protein
MLDEVLSWPDRFGLTLEESQGAALILAAVRRPMSLAAAPHSDLALGALASRWLGPLLSDG